MKDNMDNFKAHVRGCEADTLKLAVELAMGDQAIAHWGLDGEWLCFYWSQCAAAHPLPLPIKANAVIVMAAEWLLQRKPLDAEPDIDGSVSVGFELIVAEDHSYELFRVRPIWALHGK